MRRENSPAESGRPHSEAEPRPSDTRTTAGSDEGNWTAESLRSLPRRLDSPPSGAGQPAAGDRRDATSPVNDKVGERIRHELRHCGRVELRHVQVRVDGHWVELEGTLPSFYLKQVAQEVVRRVAPGRQIYNELRVTSPARRLPR